MGNPVLITGYGQFYYMCDRDPTATELDVLDPVNAGVGVYVNIPDFKYMWVNTTSKEVWWCTDNTFNAMVWHKLISSINLPSALSALGISPAVSRSRTQRTSPAFSSSYRPSTTNDIEVNLTLNFTALVSLNSQVNIQVSIDNSNWVTIYSVVRVLALATNFNDAFTFTVPVGSYYRIVQQTGTAASIVSIYELIK